MFYNDGYRPMLGEEKHPQFLGRPGSQCWAEIWDIIGPMMESVIATGEATWSEDFFLLMRRSGYLEETYFTFSYSPIRDDDGRVNGIFNACTESTGRVLADRRMKTLRAMVTEARSVGDAARHCAEALGRNPRDVPYALVYLLDSRGSRLTLVAQAGLDPGTRASPPSVELGDGGGAPWPFAGVLEHHRAQLLDGLSRRFDCLPAAPWDEVPDEALLLPIGRPGAERLAGVVVLGVSPRRAFDEAYRDFFELVAGNIATAISNAHAYEEERERAEKLAELDRAKTTFFSNVSHEFRTPLTLILGPLEDALLSPAKALRGESLEAVHRSALRLLRLVNNLLDFSRVEASRAQSRFEPTDLAVLTGGLAGSFQSLIESTGMNLTVDCGALPEPVYVDRSQWEKIVVNLISNAFKFTFQGEIAVTLRATDGHVELAVRDTGTGIPEAELPRVFERFHRVEGARGRTFEGSGIGLALVQDLVHQHGGTIRVESEVDRGSTFTVSIPRGSSHLPVDRIAPANDATPRSGAESFVLEAAHWSSIEPAGSEALEPPMQRVAQDLRILIADDNADMRAYLVRLLAPRWNVEAVSDGEAALVAARRQPPDLVLSDVMMPKLDGVGLLLALRANLATSTVPVVLLSARAGEEAVVGSLETGADDYLVKPFSARELLARIGNLVSMGRARAAIQQELSSSERDVAKLAQELVIKKRELDAALETARIARDYAERASELKTRFLGMVSHELRTPITPLRLHLDGLERRRDLLPPSEQKAVARMTHSVSRLWSIIESLLEYARVQGNQLTMHREEFDLISVLRDAVEEHRDRAKQKGLALDLSVPSPAVLLRSDSRLVRVVVTNLVDNAVKFTATGSVGVAIKPGANGHRITVRDTGPGIAPEDRYRIFEPFEQVGPLEHKHHVGVGLGLALVRDIVDALGGRIDVDSVVGEGSVFTVALPVDSTVLTRPSLHGRDGPPSRSEASGA
jgi:signal transduction histidine kinase